MRCEQTRDAARPDCGGAPHFSGGRSHQQPHGDGHARTSRSKNPGRGGESKNDLVPLTHQPACRAQKPRNLRGRCALALRVLVGTYKPLSAPNSRATRRAATLIAKPGISIASPCRSAGGTCTRASRPRWRRRERATSPHLRQSSPTHRRSQSCLRLSVRGSCI